MNIEFYRLIGSLNSVVHFVRSQYHDVISGEHGADEDRKVDPGDVKKQLDVLEAVTKDLLDEHAKISHAYFDFRRAMSRNAEAFYHATNTLRRKAPEWQIMDEDLLQLIENYQGTASSLFFGGGPSGYPPPPSSS